MDRGLFDFQGLQATGEPMAEGDIAFDVDPVMDQAPPVRAPEALRGIEIQVANPLVTSDRAGS